MKKLIIKVITLFTLAFPVLIAVPAHADNGLFNGVCSGSGSSSSVCQDSAAQGKNNPVTGTNGLLPQVTLILSLVGGAAAIILIILGGLTMVTSAGNSEKVASARRRVIYALVGLVVIGVANITVNIVIDKFT